MGIQRKLATETGQKIGVDWVQVARLLLLSRALDHHEETVLVPRASSDTSFRRADMIWRRSCWGCS